MTLLKWANFTMGVYGENSYFLLDPTEISFLVTLKSLTHIMKVSAKIRRNKKVIDQKRLTNLYEMNRSTETDTY